MQKIEKAKLAENERVKGNECVKAKDYKEAVTCYTRSIELDDTEAFSFANRAMAYLKLKDFKKVIEDATRAITMKPGYLKAFHRRGKAYHALKQHEEAIKDFQYILEEEPDNADVNKDLKESRRCLNDKLNKEPMVSEIIDDEPVTAPKIENKFKRVVIIEDSDEEDEEPKIEDVTGSAPVR